MVQAGKCPGLNNTNCGVSYTSMGAPASSLFSCCFNSAICSCCDWSIRCVATFWNTNAIALTREYGLFLLSMASAINSFVSSGFASTSVAVAPASFATKKQSQGLPAESQEAPLLIRLRLQSSEEPRSHRCDERWRRQRKPAQP